MSKLKPKKKDLYLSNNTDIESQTLRKLGDSQKIECYRTPTGQDFKLSLEMFKEVNLEVVYLDN